MYLNRSPRPPRSGKVAAVLAVSMVGVVGYLAVALEGGMLMDVRRRGQAAADTAALSAAVRLYENYPADRGTDPKNVARDAALETAARQGYVNGGAESTVTVNIPPLAGDHKGMPGYAEVVIQSNQRRYFSALFGSEEIPVTVRAVAQGKWETNPAAIMALDLSQSEALKIGGGGSILVKNADVIVNSNDSHAIGGDGSDAVLEVQNAVVRDAGGVKLNTTVIGTLLQKQPRAPDPLAYLPYPSLPSQTLRPESSRGNHHSVRSYLTALGITPDSQLQVYVLEPGRYDRLPNFGNNDVVILKQASANGAGGVYHLNGSGFTSTGATVAVDPTDLTTGGVMFYNDPGSGNSNNFQITGGTVRLSPLTSGTYAGMVFFQRRDAAEPISITGQGDVRISGTLYAAGAEMKVAGSPDAALEVLGGQYISRTFSARGNGKVRIEWTPETGRKRRLGLVE